MRTVLLYVLFLVFYFVHDVAAEYLDPDYLEVNSVESCNKIYPFVFKSTTPITTIDWDISYYSDNLAEF